MTINPLAQSAGIQSVLTQLRAHSLKDAVASINPSGKTGPDVPIGVTQPGVVLHKSFAAVLKESIDQVSSSQQFAQQLGERFIKGDDQVNLSDTMIASQKASISLQTAVQVRNRFVSAYQNIMNMQI